MNTGRFAEYRYVIRIAAKCTDVIADPGQRLNLIAHTLVTGNTRLVLCA